MAHESKSPRVVITGMGQISPLGSSLAALWDALTTGRSGVGAWQALPADHLITPYAAEARQFTGDAADFGPMEKDRQRQLRKALKVMCRETQMGVAAAQWALADAKIASGDAPGGIDPERIGVVFGSDYMMTLPEDFAASVQHCTGPDGKLQFERWGHEGLPRVEPLWLLKYLPNMPASHLAILNDLRGPSNSITQREASSNLAVGEALNILRRGQADVLVAGATGTRVHPLRSLHVMLQEELANGEFDAPRASRPFDARRTGMVLGEGAAAIIMERLEHAVARGATVYAEVIGQGSSSVADRNLIAHRDVALANAARMALRDAGISPSQLGHVHAHGLSTRTCDIDESRALRSVLDDEADRVPVVAAKSYFGNLGAASGLVELIASILALRSERLFPVLNYEYPDPECPVHAVRSTDVPAGEMFLHWNVTPQGQAAAVIVRRGVM